MTISAHFLEETILGFSPVLVFLVALLYLDSFKLVRFSTVLWVIVLGALAALASYFLSGVVMDTFHLNFQNYSRYAAPALEEGLKAAIILYLFARNRIGFMIDAAILGAAVGAGFSLFENVYYAALFPDANMSVWMVRGLGTAIMHSGVTAIFAVSAQALSERHARFSPINYIPGYLIAIALHSIFNQFIGYPLLSAAGTIIVLPLALLLVFDKSEHEAHDWLIHDYENHEALLADVDSGKFATSEVGRFIRDLTSKFNKDLVANIFAYIKLHTVLVLRAEKHLLAKEDGEKDKVGTATAENFKRLHELERKIGRAAMLTIWPHLKFSHKELWELHKLEGDAK